MTTERKPPTPFAGIAIVGILFVTLIGSVIWRLGQAEQPPAPAASISPIQTTPIPQYTPTHEPYMSRTPRYFATSSGRELPTHLPINKAATPIPTTTIIPQTISQLPSQISPSTASYVTEQPIVQPTAPVQSTAPVQATGGTLTITQVNKDAEYVIIQNNSSTAIDLTGWKLVSETGNQTCPLSGTIQPGDTLQIWSQTGATGFSCNFQKTIWNNTEPDPAVLLDPNGQEISRR